MIKVGLIGEDPNDTSSIKNLLAKRYGTVKFCPLARGVKGYQLDNAKLKRVVYAEMIHQECVFIIYIRDLDGFASQQDKIKEKQNWFNDLNKATGENNLLLLNIWELEALIFADIESFNKDYHIKHQFNGDPMFVKQPKEELKRLTHLKRKRYHESHCPQIFSKLRLDVLEKNCNYFRVFLKELDLKIS